MEKEFIKYEQALELNELGFDYQCANYYSHYGNGQVHLNNLVLCSKIGVETNRDKGILAPLYQQVFRWFREKHNIIGLVEGGYDDGKNIFTYVIWNGFKDDWCNEHVSTYEEAELECLRKLIEIVKNTSTSK